jgi:hypothetical protein
MNNLNFLFSRPGQVNPLLKLGAIALGIYVLGKLNIENDTINYTLWYRNKLVYHGICYADRLDARLNEHELRGILFDEYDYDYAKPRATAIIKERQLIQRDCPKYNIHHNY